MTQQFHFCAYTQMESKQGLKERGICTFMLTVALCLTIEMWKQPKYPSKDKWISKMWTTRKMEYYSALERKEILTYATTWVNFETIMLREIRQSWTNNI